jgi:hypothetical protein
MEAWRRKDYGLRYGAGFRILYLLHHVVIIDKQEHSREINPKRRKDNMNGGFKYFASPHLG